MPVAVILEVPLAIVKTNVFESVPPELVAVMVVLKVPAAVGVPEIEGELKDNPAGKFVTLKLVGVFEAVIV